MSDSLTLLKKELVSRSGSAELLTADNNTTQDISEATSLKLVKLDQTFPLDEDTIYAVDGKKVSLRVCYFTWANKELSGTDFLELSEKHNITPLGVLHRTDLCQWLDGTKNEFEFSSDNQAPTTGTDADGDVAMSTEDVEEEEIDEFLKSVLSKERNIVDHNTSLRGSKTVDFTNAGEMCRKIYLQEPKKGEKRAVTPEETKSKKPPTPIIIISPSASALLTMANVKAFLEKGHYVDPNTTDPQEQDYLTHSDMVMVTHVFPKLGKITFRVVDNTDKFSKAEHWERTVAVFTTGQTWQFKNYKWPSPTELFTRVKGFYFYFDKDPLPPNVKEWNVERVALDKYKRFRDAVVLNMFWDSLEKALIAKGFAQL